MAALCVTATLVVACGETEQTDETRKNLSAVAERTKAKKTYSLSFSLRSDLGGERLEMTGRGTSNADSSRGRIKGTLLQGGEEPFPVDIVTRGSTSFVSSAQLRDVLPAGKRWLRVTDENAPPSTLTPGEFLDFLLAGGEVEEVGQEEIRGEQATRYRSPVDIDTLAERTSPELAKRLKQLTGGGNLPVNIIVDVWVPDGELPSRLALKMNGKGELKGSLSITADILAYDVELDAKTPPSREVAESSELG